MASRVAVLGALLLLLLGCSSGASTALPTEGPRADPAAIWSSAGIEDYTMTYTSTCGDGAWISLDPVTVRVEEGDVERVSGDTPGKLATVANIFGLIDSARAGGAQNIETSYGEFGQPVEVLIEYSDAIDNQFCISVSEFEPG